MIKFKIKRSNKSTDNKITTNSKTLKETDERREFEKTISARDKRQQDANSKKRVEEVETKTKNSAAPVAIEFPLNKTSLTINSKCGQCMFFRRMAFPAFKVPCFERGIIRESKPCLKYSPDLSQISFVEEKNLRNIAVAIQSLEPTQLKMVAALLNQEEKSRKYGFRIGQIVYFRAFGGDYISNYTKARVAFADKEYVHIEGIDRSRVTLYHDSVLNERQWKKKELELLAVGKINDPNRKRYTQTPTKKEKQIRELIDKVIPKNLTMDMVQKNNDAVLSVGEANKNSRTAPLDKLLVVR